jgi:hypothetical protein
MAVTLYMALSLTERKAAVFADGLSNRCSEGDFQLQN